MPENARQKRAVQVELYGQRFTVRSDDDDAYIEALVGFVNEKMAEVRRATAKIETGQIALLAALDIADELFRQRRRNDELKGDITRRAEKLLIAIDQMAESLEVREAVAAVGARDSGRTPGR